MVSGYSVFVLLYVQCGLVLIVNIHVGHSADSIEGQWCYLLILCMCQCSRQVRDLRAKTQQGQLHDPTN